MQQYSGGGQAEVIQLAPSADDIEAVIIKL